MNKAKKRHAKKDPTNTAALSRPTPIELMRFCIEIGVDLFGVKRCERIASMKSTEDYEVFVKDLFRESRSDRAGSVEDKLRIALSWWTDAVHIAAGVIDEACVPAKFAKDARLKFRWLHSRNILVPKCVEEDAELQWQISFDVEWPISEEDALQLTGFKSEGGMYSAFRSFGCPSALRDLTIYAVEQLITLDHFWRNAKGVDRSKRHRQRYKKQKIIVT